MIKILIVDDEFLVRGLLASYLSDLTEIEVVGAVGSAREALDFIEETIPDIIFTDINMPIMDGMQMARNILMQRPYIKVIVITGYEEFDYARQGIELGIKDYLLKPVDKSELIRCINKTIEEIKNERKKDLELSKIMAQLNEDKIHLKEMFLAELVSRPMSLEEIGKQFEFFAIPFLDKSRKFKSFQVVTVEVLWGTEQLNNEFLDLYSLKALVKGIFSDDESMQMFFDAEKRLVVLRSLNGYYTSYQHLKTVLRGSFMGSFVIGVSRMTNSIINIHKAYRESLEAASAYKFIGINKCIHYEDLDIVQMKSVDTFRIDDEELGQLLFLVKSGVKDGANKILDDMFSRNVEDIEELRIQVGKILIMFLSMMNDLDLGNATPPYQQEHLLRQLYKIRTLPEFQELVVQTFNDTIDCINNVRTNMVKSTINEIENYLQSNLSDSELSLTGVASYFYMNSSYLSRVFKQKKGISFREYINKLRMEKASEFLKDTDIKLYEIGKKVGIQDPNYFSLLFKKYMGMSPSEYRNTK